MSFGPFRLAGARLRVTITSAYRLTALPPLSRPRPHRLLIHLDRKPHRLVPLDLEDEHLSRRRHRGEAAVASVGELGWRLIRGLRDEAFAVLANRDREVVRSIGAHVPLPVRDRDRERTRGRDVERDTRDRERG